MSTHTKPRPSLTLPGWESTRGVLSRTAKLTEDQVREIRARKESIAKAAKRYGVSTRTIEKVRARRTYWEVKDSQ
jgi:DNA-binding transcriptional regulator YiaG